MTSETTREFRDRLAALPPGMRSYARRIYKRWQSDPWHPSLRFKTIHPSLPVYSVRIGLHWRAIGVMEGDRVIWFWIGSHKEYDQKIDNLRRRT